MSDLEEIRGRDAASADTWFTGPASFTALAARDRRELLKEVAHLEDMHCQADVACIGLRTDNRVLRDHVAQLREIIRREPERYSAIMQEFRAALESTVAMSAERDRLAQRVKELERAKASVTLTITELRDLVKIVEGYDQSGVDDETEYTIERCCPEGVRDSVGDEPEHYRWVAYDAEYPDEGVLGLGKPLAAKERGE